MIKALFPTLRFLPYAAACVLLGCDHEPADPDAGAADASVWADSGTDSGLDGGRDTTPDDGGVASTDLTVTYDAHTEPFERAVFGYEREDGEPVGLYFELYRGGAEGCPNESSPSPDQTLVVSGFRGIDPAVQTDEDGVRVTFFDFEGLFYDDIRPVAAAEVTLEVTAHAEARAAEVTLDATLRSDASGAVVEGTAHGTFVATHCESLDADG